MERAGWWLKDLSHLEYLPHLECLPELICLSHLKCLPHPLECCCPPFRGVVSISEQELRQLPLRDPAGGVRLLLGELQPEDLTLQPEQVSLTSGVFLKGG